MAWRDNIKVLGIKAKALPLAASMLLHVIMLFAFAIASHEREKVFNVELLSREIKGHAVLKVKTERKMPVAGSKAMEAGNLEQKPAAVIDRHEEAVRQADEAMKREERGLKDSPPLTGGDEGEGEKAPLPLSTKGGEGGFSDVKHSMPAKGVLEANFGLSSGPSFFKMIKPEYPRLARRLGREGRVVLRLFIDEHGRLLKVETVEKAGHGFDEAAVDAIKASTFRPAKLNGHPVACKAILPVRFRLE